jgi:hypothetical protein
MSQKSKKHKNSRIEKMSSESKFATNIFKLNSIFVANILDNYNRKLFREMFEKFGRIIEIFHPRNTSFAFVHFDNQFSPINAIAKWNNKSVDGISTNKLRIAFTPFKNQRESYYRMTHNFYKLIVNKSGECHYWRSGKKCPNGRNCHYKHLSANKFIDPVLNKKKFFRKPKVNFENKRKPNNRKLSTTKQIINALNNGLI